MFRHFTKVINVGAKNKTRVTYAAYFHDFFKMDELLLNKKLKTGMNHPYSLWTRAVPYIRDQLYKVKLN